MFSTNFSKLHILQIFECDIFSYKSVIQRYELSKTPLETSFLFSSARRIHAIGIDAK